jgi:hypothetical protein
MAAGLARVRGTTMVAMAAMAALSLSSQRPAVAQVAAPAPYAPPAAAPAAPATNAYPPVYYPPPDYAPPPAYAPPPGYPPPDGYPPPEAYPPLEAYPPPTPASPSPEPPAAATRFGVGYKIGNGLGLVGGDIVVSPFPHLVLDAQASSLSVNTVSGTATGFGFAPELQFDVREPGRSTPYVGVGYLYARVSLDNVTAWANGFFINAGYEWKWSSGLGLLLGGGACYLGEIKATDGTTTISQGAELVPSLEFSVRFMFL